MDHPSIVSRDEWLAARRAHLTKEKELTRLYDGLREERQRLPWVAVERSYTFDAAEGAVTLGELFDGKSQLVIYHFMFGPDWQEGCPSCSLLADHVDPSLPHLGARDVAFAAVSRATIAQIEAFRKRMGWQFRWVSSNGNDFNRDYHVSFSKDEVAAGTSEYNFGTGAPFPIEEAPGLSVFSRDESGRVYHTYSSYGRGPEPFLGVYHFLDVVPKGRDESGLPWPMAWVRHHDRYAR
jgi:predicted dithiol-disulfide oxidoreductase (DUF899 family)